jgi:hypothetical protein
MSFFKNLFSAATALVNKFPQYTEFLSSVEALRTAGALIIDSDMTAFSAEFQRFADSQSDEIKPTLTAIKTAGEGQARSMRHLWSDLSKLPADLDGLRVKNLEFQNRQKEVETAKELARTSRAAVAPAQVALDKAEVKGNQAEIRRLSDRLEQARKKADDDEAAAATAGEDWGEFQKRYPVEFTDLVASTLEPVVDAKLKELEELATAADSFLEAAGKFENYQDPSIARLTTRLEELNAVVIE